MESHEKGQKPQINPREWDKGFSVEPGEEYGRVSGEGAEDGLRKEALRQTQLLQHLLTGLLGAAQLHRTISPAPCTDARCSRALRMHCSWKPGSRHLSHQVTLHTREPKIRELTKAFTVAQMLSMRVGNGTQAWFILGVLGFCF